MKDYIDEFYNEGFGLIFCKRPLDYLSKLVKNKKLYNIIKIIIKVLYTILIIGIAIILFIAKWPL